MSPSEGNRLVGQEVQFRPRDGIIRTGKIMGLWYKDHYHSFEFNIKVTKGPDVGYGFSVNPDEIDDILRWLSEV